MDGAVEFRDFTPTIHTDTYPAIQLRAGPRNLPMRGRTVLITGASRGIGRAMALAYALAGAYIAIAARSRSDLWGVECEILYAIQDALDADADKAPPLTGIELLNFERDTATQAAIGGGPQPRVLRLHMDVQDQASVDAAVEQVRREFGRLDILVNNAGHLETWRDIADSDPAEWWRTWDVTIRGTYLVTRAFLPILLRGGAGGLKTIVNIGSAGAVRQDVGGSGYQTAKFALLRFTEFINTEYRDKGVLAFVIHPGGVVTELAQGMPKCVQDEVLTDTPELAADTTVFLTRERRDWLAGRFVSAKWDMPQLLARKDEIVQGNKLVARLVL